VFILKHSITEKNFHDRIRAPAKAEEKVAGDKARSPLQDKHRNRGAKHHKRNNSNRDP